MCGRGARWRNVSLRLPRNFSLRGLHVKSRPFRVTGKGAFSATREGKRIVPHPVCACSSPKSHRGRPFNAREEGTVGRSRKRRAVPHPMCACIAGKRENSSPSLALAVTPAPMSSLECRDRPPTPLYRLCASAGTAVELADPVVGFSCVAAPPARPFCFRFAAHAWLRTARLSEHRLRPSHDPARRA